MKDDKIKIEQRLQDMKNFYIRTGEMIDKLLVIVWLIGWPISTGYFYNRPFCNDAPGTCAFITATIWPFTLLANVSVRIFEQ